MANPADTSHREIIALPVGLPGPNDTIWAEAEVRAITAGDEFFIGKSPEYNRFPNDLVFRTLILSRAVERIGDKKNITMADIQRLHAQDTRVLEEAVYRLTYGSEATRRVRCPHCGETFEDEGPGPSG